MLLLKVYDCKTHSIKKNNKQTKKITCQLMLTKQLVFTHNNVIAGSGRMLAFIAQAQIDAVNYVFYSAWYLMLLFLSEKSNKFTQCDYNWYVSPPPPPPPFPIFLALLKCTLVLIRGLMDNFLVCYKNNRLQSLQKNSTQMS